MHFIHCHLVCGITTESNLEKRVLQKKMLSITSYRPCNNPTPTSFEGFNVIKIFNLHKSTLGIKYHLETKQIFMFLCDLAGLKLSGSE